MSNKPNPLLAKLEAKKEAEHRERVRTHSEIHIMAMIIAAHNALGVGPGRADKFLVEYVNAKTQIAQEITADIGDSHRKKGGAGDPEFLYTKRNLAGVLKRIFGPDKWRHYRDFFPMLRDYWEG